MRVVASGKLYGGVRRYCAWQKVGRAWLLAQGLLFCGVVFTAAYVLGDKLLFVGFSYWLVGGAAAIVALVVLLVYFLFLPVRPAQVCYLIDRNAGLKNLVASGVSVRHERDEVSELVSARAERALSRQKPSRLLPLRRHWTGRYLYLPLALLVAGLLLPRMDLLKRKLKRETAEAERLAVEKGALTLAAKLVSIEGHKQVLESIAHKKITSDFEKLAKDLSGTAKKDALVKLGEFENKYKAELAAQRDFEKAVKALAAKPDMTGLAKRSREPMNALSKSLKQSDFRTASKALRDLSKQLSSKDLSVSEKKALARELGKLAETMKGAGMSEALAKLLREIEASPEDLANLLKCCSAASEELDEFARFCSECDGLKAMRDGLAEAKEGMLGDGFCGFDEKEVEAYMRAQASLGMCQGCNGAGCGMCGGAGAGNGFCGTGGEGKGRGGRPPEGMTDTSFESTLSPSKVNKGKILHQLFVSGVPEKGEALVEYAEVVKTAKREAASSLARDRIPREYEGMVKRYFDSLEQEKP